MAIKITRDELNEYAEMLQRKADIDTEAAAIKEAIAQFETKVQTQLVESKKESTKRFGWLFALVAGNGSVSWKKEFIRVAGKEAAVELASNVKGNGKVKLNVTPPQDLAALFKQAEADSDE